MLPFDERRCAGRDNLLPDKEPCQLRATCRRYLEFIHWPKDERVNVPVMLCTDTFGDCEYYMEDKDES